MLKIFEAYQEKNKEHQEKNLIPLAVKYLGSLNITKEEAFSLLEENPNLLYLIAFAARAKENSNDYTEFGEYHEQIQKVIEGILENKDITSINLGELYDIWSNKIDTIAMEVFQLKEISYSRVILFGGFSE